MVMMLFLSSNAPPWVGSRSPDDWEVEIETLLQLNLWNLGLVWFIVTFHKCLFSKAAIQLQYELRSSSHASLASSP